MHRVVVVGILLALAAEAAPREAPREPVRDPQTLRARELFTHAEALYALTRYAEALAKYESAFEIKPLPGFLFNIGQCHRQLGHPERAAYFYRTYLAREPLARNRQLVESLLREVEGAPTPPASGTPASPPPSESLPALASDAGSGAGPSDAGALTIAPSPIAAPRIAPSPIAPSPIAPSPIAPPPIAPSPFNAPPPARPAATAPIAGPPSPTLATSLSQAPPPPVPFHRRWYVWVGGAGALAAITAGLVVGLAPPPPPSGTLDTIRASQ